MADYKLKLLSLQQKAKSKKYMTNVLMAQKFFLTDGEILSTRQSIDEFIWRINHKNIRQTRAFLVLLEFNVKKANLFFIKVLINRKAKFFYTFYFILHILYYIFKNKNNVSNKPKILY
ncbi:hypothetical protein BpHYR1_013370 [Brachionus plicatilis]|uniref:Uncharacterized protein n=1 Tax=Brachionus plicatilis TaxID=10195 RepID=A0A3M7SZK8_BRAPC|nr:hypothetical protein BpHYR1_013370 [Brachionus plicatilis]